jgi:methyltransferase
MTGVDRVAFVVAVVVGLLLAETRISRRHEARLRAGGAFTPPGDVYVWLAVLYPLSFLLMGLEGAWRAASAAPAPAGRPGPSWFAAGLLLFVAGKGLKYWAIRTLGERWTFRVFVVPWLPLVRSGPYRYLAHPNYVGLVGELVGTAMMVGARIMGPAMLGAFGAALWARLRFEQRVMADMTAATVTGRKP